MTEGRSCACGCGEKLPNGRRNRRFVSNAHRMRARRAESARNEQVDGYGHVVVADEGGQPLSSNGSMGRVRGGLEAWLKTREALPEVLVSSARVLADELDAASDSSPLWGR